MTTTIVPIPKITNPQSWEDYKLIALSNVFSRILSKVIYSYLKDQLPILISKEQAGFVQGRNIHDNIMLAKEISHAISYNQLKDNAILKLDGRHMTKWNGNF